MSSRLLGAAAAKPFLAGPFVRAPSSSFTRMSTSSAYKVATSGKPFTPAYRVQIQKDGQKISPFHDIPLYANKEKTLLNMVVEIPRWTNAKIEIATCEAFNPLKQDVKKGKVRFVRNCFPYKGYIWNYGALPQTWEDPTSVHADTKARGDNDPVDVCEIGEGIGYCGQVKQVKVLGVMALLDEGETDWKLIAIDNRDPMAEKLNDIADVEKHLPGLIDATRHWFKVYKMPDGKPANKFAFDGQCKDKAYATHVIEETHDAWKRLIQGKIPAKADTHDISVANTTVDDSPYRINDGSNVKSVESDTTYTKQEPKIDGKDDKWYYIRASL